ncbi:MAG: hypothetical protein JW955_01150 [Sedimentisphaerales bacterium]|nr:hypothetical protein [Sedimentisphaerales bacterium]
MLLWTYLVLTLLNLWVANACCRAIHNPVIQVHWKMVLYAWGMLHILPVWATWDTGTAGPLAWGIVLVAGSCVLAGVLTKGRWIRFLIIPGMSLWFFEAWCLLGLSV